MRIFFHSLVDTGSFPVDCNQRHFSKNASLVREVWIRWFTTLLIRQQDFRVG